MVRTEMALSILARQCMLWQTLHAVAEMEMRMLDQSDMTEADVTAARDAIIGLAP